MTPSDQMGEGREESLRDRFAMTILSAMLSHAGAADLGPGDEERVAYACYTMADAMMKARAQ